MLLDDRAGDRDALRIERRKRLVQYPQGAGRGELQPRQRGTALLTLREQLAGKAGSLEAVRLERLGVLRLGCSLPRNPRRVAQVFARIELILEGVQVADVGEGSAVVLARLA